jgi:hypothetical protein
MAATNFLYVFEGLGSSGVVLVTNGVYKLKEDIQVSVPVLMRSVNGPSVTTLDGQLLTRCLSVFDPNGRVSGFTICNGRAALSGGGVSLVGHLDNCLVVSNAAPEGGGIRCVDSVATISNCTIAFNCATSEVVDALSCAGGGVFGGRVLNSTVNNNCAMGWGGGVVNSRVVSTVIRENSALGVAGRAGYGGGAIQSTLIGCLVERNTANYGGGTESCSNFSCNIVGNVAISRDGGVRLGRAHNCIVCFNSAGANDNYGEDALLTFSCSTPLAAGEGNMAADPGLITASRLAAGSPCAGIGSTNELSAADFDGESWRLPPSIGCDERYEGNLVGDLVAAVDPRYTICATGFALRLTCASLSHIASNRWEFGDGTVQRDAFQLLHAWEAPAEYLVSLTSYNRDHVLGITTTIVITVEGNPDRFVARANPQPVHPFATWTTAATSIQQAADAAIPGGTVWVSNGVYDTGSSPTPGGFLLNRLVLTNPVVVRSVNGPESVQIVGQGPMGSNAVRGVFLGPGASLVGVTVMGGHTFADVLRIDANVQGGGIYASGAVVSNCWILGNEAQPGGGIHYGTVFNCIIRSNTAHDYYNPGVGLSSCGYGGGANSSTIHDSRLLDNTANRGGGGASDCELRNCILAGNRVVSLVISGIVFESAGGGAAASSLNSCTVIGNDAVSGGGVAGGRVANSIVYYNSGSMGANYATNVASFSFEACCVVPLPTGGVGNIDSPPEFVNLQETNVDLLSTSPCIDAGLNKAWMTNATDVAGRPRLMNGRVDIGAHEFRYESSLTALLGGAWDETNAVMRAGKPPPDSPYATATLVVSNVPTNAVDWILVSARQSPTSPPVASVSAYLMPDRSVRGADGSTSVYVEAKGILYGVLQHRNHQAVMSAYPIFTNRLVTFDFSADPNALYGGTNSVVQVATNRWAMRAGDGDGDGEIGPADLLIWQTQEGK